MNFTREILLILKRKYVSAVGRPMKSDTAMHSSQAEFYFEQLEDNLIEPMGRRALQEYGNGSGNELDEKMRALRSSSALTFNLFGNDRAIVTAGSAFEPGKYDVHFEKQLPTIRNNPHPANLDACLLGESELIFCEMKLTEWLFNRPGTLRERYLDETLYFEPEAFPAFKACAEQIMCQEPSDYHTYESIFQQYDAFQMFKHTLAIYHYAFENRGRIPKKIRLVNCVWELDDSSLLSEKAESMYLEKEAREHREFCAFYAAAADIREQFSAIGYDFDIAYMSAADFSGQFQKTTAQREYLKRYF